MPVRKCVDKNFVRTGVGDVCAVLRGRSTQRGAVDGSRGIQLRMKETTRIVETMGPGLTKKRMASWVARAMVAAVLAAMAVPGRAADERAIKSRVAPIYPEIAKRMRVSGVVRLEVTVDAEGRVTAVKPVSGNQMLSTAAQEAVKKWRFASGDGQATVQVSLNFDLN